MPLLWIRPKGSGLSLALPLCDLQCLHLWNGEGDEMMEGLPEAADNHAKVSKVWRQWVTALVAFSSLGGLPLMATVWRSFCSRVGASQGVEDRSSFVWRKLKWSPVMGRLKARAAGWSLVGGGCGTEHRRVCCRSDHLSVASLSFVCAVCRPWAILELSFLVPGISKSILSCKVMQIRAILDLLRVH